MTRSDNAIAIIYLSIASAIFYGIAQDQITVRVCLEYFTVGHVPIFGEHPPTILAILWGAAASWWVGFFLGLLLAYFASSGSSAFLPVKRLFRPILILLSSMFLSALVSGTVGYYLAKNNLITLRPIYASRVDKSRHPLFMADAFAHSAAYLVGFIGGLLIVIWVKRTRANEQKVLGGET